MGNIIGNNMFYNLDDKLLYEIKNIKHKKIITYIDLVCYLLNINHIDGLDEIKFVCKWDSLCDHYFYSLYGKSKCSELILIHTFRNKYMLNHVLNYVPIKIKIIENVYNTFKNINLSEKLSGNDISNLNDKILRIKNENNKLFLDYKKDLKYNLNESINNNFDNYKTRIEKSEQAPIEIEKQFKEFKEKIFKQLDYFLELLSIEVFQIPIAVLVNENK